MPMDFKLHPSYQDWVDFCKSQLPLPSSPPEWKAVETLTYMQYSAYTSVRVKSIYHSITTFVYKDGQSSHSLQDLLFHLSLIAI